MKNKFDQLARFQRINDFLNSIAGRRISTKRLSEELGVSERTIHEDFKRLKEDFDAPIKYDGKMRAYYYTEAYEFSSHIGLKPQEITSLKLAVATLKQYNSIGLFHNLEGLLDKLEQAVHLKTKQQKVQLDFIQFESVPHFSGNEHLDFFIQAIQNQEVVSFEYQKFKDDIISFRVIHPYFLKEHRNRWYIVGLDEEKSGNKVIKAFGLDRLNHTQLRKDKTYLPNKADLVALLGNSFGIFINYAEKPQEIILSFSPQRAKYLKTQAFHNQQLNPTNILRDDDVEFKVKLQLLINDELVMELARLGKDVKVIAPPSLRESLIQYLEGALKQQL